MLASLARGLRARGHRVAATGPIWQGWRLPTRQDDKAKIEAHVSRIIASQPDVVLVLRTSALRPEQVDRLKAAGIFTVAWFSDDPVLYKVQTSRTAPHYDLTLHAASGSVLEFYEANLGVRGVSFPFWTDEIARPRSYDPRLCDQDLVFLGNTHTRVKRWRYDWIASLAATKLIYGTVSEDPAGIHAGVANSEPEMVRAAVRGRLGLNISQRFSDYVGTRFDFEELSGFGEFLLPSRIVQLAALGVPVVSFVSDTATARALYRVFPSVVSVSSKSELADLVTRILDDEGALLELSQQVHDWYRKYYTAAARARFLELLVRAPEKWTSLDALERSEAFMSISTNAGRIGNTMSRFGTITRRAWDSFHFSRRPDVGSSVD